jgi:predicted Rossmann fold nucleotide-binding protein DprA/Smf involved in DNA uptake
MEPASRTVDMLRNRADMVDPQENKKLYALIEQRGAIITDLPMGFHPAPETRGLWSQRTRSILVR